MCTLVWSLLGVAMTASASCPDVDGDGFVNIDDLVAVIIDQGTDGVDNHTDVDGSGVVDIDDVLAILSAWGPFDVSCGPPPDIDIHFWYGERQVFGDRGRPQQQGNVLGTVTAVNGLATLTCAVNGGEETLLSVGPDQRRLADPGDFNIELFYDELPLGASEVTVRAVDLLGNELVQSMTVEHRPETEWALPYSIDWSDVDDLHDVVDVTDGRWDLTPNGIRCADPDYDRLAVLGDVTWQNYEMTVPVTIHGVDESGFEWPSLFPAVGIVFRWTGHTDLFNRGAQPNQGWWPLGAAFEYVFRQSGCGNRLELYGNPFALRDEDETCSLQMQFDETYMWKMKVRTTAIGHRYKFKVWSADEPEPGGWMMNVLEDLGQPGFGSIGLLAHHVDVTFGDIVVEPVEP